jgi:hypothetical protein
VIRLFRIKRLKDMHIGQSVLQHKHCILLFFWGIINLLRASNSKIRYHLSYVPSSFVIHFVFEIGASYVCPGWPWTWDSSVSNWVVAISGIPGSPYVALVGLKLVILWPQPPECCNYKYAPSQPASKSYWYISMKFLWHSKWNSWYKISTVVGIYFKNLVGHGSSCL